jgi:hypothetical protein
MAGRGVHVDVFDDLSPHPSSSVDGRVQIVELEPYQDPMAIPPAVGIDEVRVILLVPGMELEHQRAVYEESIVKVIVVRRHQLARARGPEQSRVPAGARAHVSDGEQGLWADGGDHAIELISNPNTLQVTSRALSDRSTRSVLRCAHDAGSEMSRRSRRKSNGLVKMGTPLMRCTSSNAFRKTPVTSTQRTGAS